jgi:dTMP kinase
MLIVFEGIDGCGKTTQMDRLEARLQAAGRRCRRLREPGGTVLGERQRALLLDPATQACPAAELFGYLQARAQLCHEVIVPALAAGEIVLLDRFWYSTIAYQCHGLGVDESAVRAALKLAVGPVKADSVLWFAVDPAVAADRRAAARGQDRIEARGLAYLTRVHQGYAAMAAGDGLVRIDASASVDAVERAVWEQLAPLVG